MMIIDFLESYQIISVMPTFSVYLKWYANLVTVSQEECMWIMFKSRNEVQTFIQNIDFGFREYVIWQTY